MYESESTDKTIVLTEADRQQINNRARRDLLETVVAQVSLGSVVALLCLVFGGISAAASSLAGSAAYVLPNAAFALRLWLSTYRPGGANPALFFIGEFLKVGASVGLLWLISQLGGEQVRWLAVLAGLVAVLKAYVVLLLFKGSRAK
ncbi:MAG: ATP synthase subunit I [Alcaligenaceae bacterium]|nr:ATP synthase subunit I [Alcaligenaceae bacterium]